MAELSARRIVAVSVLAGALVGGAVAAGVAAAVAGGGNNGAASKSSGSSASVATAAVVRTNLTTAVQVGGSIGYQGSYVIAAPSGASPDQLAQAKQTVAQDQQTLSADEQAESDASNADNQTTAAGRTDVSAAKSTLDADRGEKTTACRTPGTPTATCSQDSQQVRQDRSQLTQAHEQLAAAESAARQDRDRNQDTVASDETTLHGDQATLASLQATAVNPGTTYTWLPQVGEVIHQDQRVYSLSNQPVPLLYGSIAVYRAFTVGMSGGADVGELTRDLIALGYGAGLSPSTHYSAATVAAVQRWQRAVGLPATGEIPLGQVVVEPGPIRVTSVTPAVGQAVGSSGGGTGGGGTVLTASGTTPIVTVDLDVSEEYLVKPGDAVTVVLPDGTSTVGGRIETVGTVATCPGGGDIGLGTGGSSAIGSPCSAVGSNSTSTPTVTVTIRMDHTPAGASGDQAPVDVNVTSQRAEHVLAVPVNALLALAGGGFGVDVVTGGTSHLVAVTTGLYSNTLVQVSGSGVSAGTRVEVPSA